MNERKIDWCSCCTENKNTVKKPKRKFKVCSYFKKKKRNTNEDFVGRSRSNAKVTDTEKTSSFLHPVSTGLEWNIKCEKKQQLFLQQLVTLPKRFPATAKYWNLLMTIFWSRKPMMLDPPLRTSMTLSFYVKLLHKKRNENNPTVRKILLPFIP